MSFNAELGMIPYCSEESGWTEAAQRRATSSMTGKGDDRR